MNAYLGPYIRFKQEVVSKIASVDGCPKCKVQKYTSDKFCPSCGTEHGKFEKKIKENKIHPMQLAHDLNIVDHLSHSDVYGHDIYTPNQHLVGVENKRELYLDANDESFSHITARDISIECGIFERQYASEIESIGEAYGQPTTIYWGLLIWAEK
jgi:hypothetical protein